MQLWNRLKNQHLYSALLLDAAVGIWELTGTDLPLRDESLCQVFDLCVQPELSTEMALKKQWPVVFSAQVFST